VEIILFIGIQASGKTSFYQHRFFQTHVRVSLDLLKTRKRETVLMQACLSTQQRFVVDNTNPTRAERARYIALARQAKFKVIAYFFEPYPDLVVRHAPIYGFCRARGWRLRCWQARQGKCPACACRLALPAP
jgi:predicted kinase